MTLEARLNHILKVLPTGVPCPECPPNRHLITVAMTGEEPGPAPRCPGCDREPLEHTIVRTDLVVSELDR